MYIPLSRTKLFHNIISLLLWHVSMHRTDSEVGLLHFLCEPVHLPFSVTENHSLCDGQSVIQVTQSVKLPLLSLYSYKELLNAFQSQLVTRI